MAATATIPQLGFVHEDSGQSFVLDVADLFRDAVTVPQAFRAVALLKKRPSDGIERLTRRLVGETMRRDGVIASMIDRIKTLLEEPDAPSTPDRPRVNPAPSDEDLADLRSSAEGIGAEGSAGPAEATDPPAEEGS